MKPLRKVFSAFFPTLAIVSLLVFAQLGTSFLLGAMLDQGISGQLLWLLPFFGLLGASVCVVASIALISGNTDGYHLRHFHISGAFLLFYCLILACFISFLLFGVASVVSQGLLIRQTGLNAIAFPVLLLVSDGLGFFGAAAFRSKKR